MSEQSATIRNPMHLDMAAKLAFAVTALVLIGAMIWAIPLRSPWYDEFYTLYVTRPGLGWAEATAEHWLPDNHPPLFYALAHATRWLGDSLEARRYLNLLIALAAMAGAMVALRGDDRSRPLAVVYFMLLAAQTAAFPFVAELRSYFLSFCSTALLVLTLVLVWLDEEMPGRGRRIVFAVSALAALNTHIVTSLVAGALVLPFLAGALLKRDYRRFRILLLPMLAAGLVFVVTVAVQFPLWISNTENFWIPAGHWQVLGALQMVGHYAVSANLAILVAGLAGLGFLLVTALRGNRLPKPLEAALLLGAGVLLAGALSLAVHIWRPLVIPKYLIGLIPGIAMVLAIGFREVVGAVCRTAALALLGTAALLSLVAIVRSVSTVAALGGWDGTASVIGRQVELCPGTLVHTDPHWNTELSRLQPADNARVVPYSYRLMARRNGFAVEPAASRRLSEDCPTLFWAEHVPAEVPGAAEVLAHVRRRGFEVSRLEFYPIDKGWIASTEPIDKALAKAD